MSKIKRRRVKYKNYKNVLCIGTTTPLSIYLQLIYSSYLLFIIYSYIKNLYLMTYANFNYMRFHQRKYNRKMIYTDISKHDIVKHMYFVNGYGICIKK